MAISDLEALKTAYSSTSASTMIPAFYDALIEVLTAQNGKITAQASTIRALTARVKALEDA